MLRNGLLQKIKNFQYLQWAAAALIILLYIPYLITGEESFVGHPFDYLNSNVVWNKLVLDSGSAWASNCADIFPNIMGQPRVVLGSQISFILLLYYLLPVFWVLIVNSLLISLVALYSMHRLLNYLIPDLQNIWRVAIALLFALLPFWQWAGIAVTGFPIIFIITDQLLSGTRTKWFDWLFVLFYLFYSNFIVYNSFLYLFLSIYVIAHLLIFRIIRFKPLIFIGLLFIVGIIIEYRMVLFSLDPCFISNRTTLYKGADFNIQNIFTNLRFGGQHARPLHFPFITALLALYIVFDFKQFFRDRFMLISMSIIVATEILSGGIGLLIVNDLLKIDFLSGFSLHRFNSINQILWYVVLAYLIYKIWQKKSRVLQTAAVLAIFGQFIIISLENTPLKNIRSQISPEKFAYNVKYADYYLVDEYPEIEKILLYSNERQQLKVVHYGLDPAASSYHGFSTADGFLPVYAQSAEIQFNKILQPRLESNPAVYQKRTFHNYLVTENYSAGQNHLQQYSKNAQHLNVDFGILKETGATHLISTVPFTNNNLSLLAKVNSDYWKVLYIYRIVTSNKKSQ